MEMHYFLTSLVKSIIEISSVEISSPPKGHDIDTTETWNRNIEQLKIGKCWYELALSYDSVGRMKIGNAPALNKLSYWALDTIGVFEGFAFLIKASIYYKLAEKWDEATLAARFLILILKEVLQRNILDEQALVGLVYELMGDCCLILNDKAGYEYYEKAKIIYRQELHKEPDFEATWEVQEEFQAIYAVFLDTIKPSDLPTSFEGRVNKKQILLQKGKLLELLKDGL